MGTHEGLFAHSPFGLTRGFGTAGEDLLAGSLLDQASLNDNTDLRALFGTPRASGVKGSLTSEPDRLGRFEAEAFTNRNANEVEAFSNSSQNSRFLEQPAGLPVLLDASSAATFNSNRSGDEPFTPILTLGPGNQNVSVDDPSPTISVLWNRAVREAVINAISGPTVASRAYGILNTAMFDTWAAYNRKAIATQLGDDLQRPQSENTNPNKTEAMSFAAYRILADLFPSQVGIFDDLMAELGFDPNNTTTDTTTAAGIGNVSAAALLEFRRNDGSNQLANDPNGTPGVPYSDISGYEPVNSPENIPESINDIERWTPERRDIDNPDAPIQRFLTPHWGNVTPFALESGDQLRPEAPQPFLLVDGEADLEAGTITLEDGEVVEISKDIVGTIINPGFIEQTERIVEISANLTDEQKIIAEFWEDGGGTPFPPGTWLTFGEFVSARDNHSLAEDAKMFFALGNALFDAGVATWEAKRFYDYTRPGRAVRELGRQGLIGEFSAEQGGFVIDAFQPFQGTQTILATDFLTYQTPVQDPAPPFAEYTSGHSAFSAGSAEILKRFTDSDAFGGFVTLEPGSSRFEPGFTPQNPVTLEWETFSEAADEAGISRQYGGIHFDEGDQFGRQLGRQVGAAVFEQAQFFIQGGEAEPEPVFGTNGDDILEAGLDFDGDQDVVFGGSGDDILDASAGAGGNRLFGNDGNDILFAGSGDRLLGGKGDDTFFITDGGDNLLTGGVGVDTFRIANGELPPSLNTITDFQVSVDVISVGGIGAASTNDLVFSQVENNAVIAFAGSDLVKLLNTQASNLAANGIFVFA